MTPNYKIIVGDVRERLSELSEGSVRCCITSPPYWGLRDYGTANWKGGDESCDHKSGRFERGGLSKKQASSQGSAGDETFWICPKCGAERQDLQIGLEQTPDEYVAEMVSVFREVRRVLADDGTLWLNLGDSYNTSPAGNKKPSGFQQQSNAGTTGALAQYGAGRKGLPDKSLKPKDLVGIPWRVAFALQADGWYLRQDIIWHKPNPMPESVTDRCTKSHEYVFLLAKSPRYYYDNKANAEPAIHAGQTVKASNPDTAKNGAKGKFGRTALGFTEHDTVVGETKNRRSVWTVNTKPFKGAHFAVMPEALVEPCLLAGSAVGDTVLDPFAGSGTVGVVSLRHGRNFVGIELNPDYADIANKRITESSAQQTLFHETQTS